jgi:hypothetical protein
MSIVTGSLAPALSFQKVEDAWRGKDVRVVGILPLARTS